MVGRSWSRIWIYLGSRNKHGFLVGERSSLGILLRFRQEVEKNMKESRGTELIASK